MTREIPGFKEKYYKLIIKQDSEVNNSSTFSAQNL
jgi:hypothetical protein